MRMKIFGLLMVALFAALLLAAFAPPTVVSPENALAIAMTTILLPMLCVGVLQFRAILRETSTVRRFAIALAPLMVLALVAMPMPAHAQQTYRDATSGFIKEATFYTSGSRTGPGNTGTPVDVGAYDSAILLINVTVAGTTMTVNFDNCIDSAGTKCGAVKSTTAITATGFYVIQSSNFGRYARVSFTSTGAFTFEVLGVFKPTT